MPQNHVIDPTWFYDVIEEFAFNYDWYVVTGYRTDEHFKQVANFSKNTIRGSLQTGGVTLKMDKAGNTQEMTYDFYCKSLYRIDIGDFILYKKRYLHVEQVDDYDEFGVRHAKLRMVNLNNYKDFEEYLKYLNGEVIV